MATFKKLPNKYYEPKRGKRTKTYTGAWPKGLYQQLDELEFRLLTRAYLEAEENVTEAGRLLGIPRTTLYMKLLRFGIE